MKAMRLLAGMLVVFTVLPISLWLQYQILKRVDASELMWFLFWVNVPLLFFLQVIAKLLEWAERK
jgi:hypothetical protein